MGLQWNEGPDIGGPYGPYRQSERSAIYREYLQRLLDENKAYDCFCTKEQLDADRQESMAKGVTPIYVGRCSHLAKEEQERRLAAGESAVIRLRVEREDIHFHDIIRGDIVVHSDGIGDIVIARNIDTPLFVFAGVVDDHLMQISHVIRGEDHLSNVPKQILLQRALGFPTPEYVHMPLILAPDRSKLSKRYIETSLNDFRTQGYLPEALVNFMAFIGWHPKDDKELMTVEALVGEFDIERMQKGGGIFNLEKLEWLNAQYIKRLSVDALVEVIAPFIPEAWQVHKELLRGAIMLERERMKKLTEFSEAAAFLFDLPVYDDALLLWKETTKDITKDNLQAILEAIRAISSEQFTQDAVEGAIMPIAEQRGRGAVMWPLRVAVSGKKASPGPVEIMVVLGKHESIRRIEFALQKLH